MMTNLFPLLQGNKYVLMFIMFLIMLCKRNSKRLYAFTREWHGHFYLAKADGRNEYLN